MEISVSLCENCEKRDGVTNSGYWIDQDWLEETGETQGHWVCAQCEEEIAKEWSELYERNSL